MDAETKAILRELIASRSAPGVPPESAQALAAAKREFDGDPNRRDRKHTQERMDASVHELRVGWGLEPA